MPIFRFKRLKSLAHNVRNMYAWMTGSPEDKMSGEFVREELILVNDKIKALITDPNNLEELLPLITRRIALLALHDEL